MAVGVPESPQVGLKSNPAGSEGDDEHEVIAPPVLVTAAGAIAEFLVKVKGVPA